MIKLILAGFPCTQFSIAQNNNRIDRVDFTADEFIEWKTNTKNWWLHIDEFETLVGSNLNIKNYKFALGLQLFFNCVVAVDRAKANGDTIYYLFENVASMQKQIKQVIEKMLNKLYGGIMTEINSAKVSAQNRKRIYFTNFGKIEQPEDRGLLLKDIVLPLDQVDVKHYWSEKAIKGWQNTTYSTGKNRLRKLEQKSPTCCARDFKDPTSVIQDGVYRNLTPKEYARLQTVPDWYIMPCSNSQQYKMYGNGWNIETILHIVKHIPGINTEEVQVLSLYDGMSCGRIVLKELNCNVKKYSAYEIDKYAIQATQANFPDVNELGDAFAVRNANWSF